MARRTTEIQYNVTGQVVAERLLEGQASACTFKVFSERAADDGTVEFSGSASIDAVDTTVDQASGPAQADPHRLYLASTASMVAHRKYLLEENSRKEWIEVVEIESGQWVRARYPLRGNYTTAATLKGTYVEATVDATWIADEDNISNHADPYPDWRVRWEATIGGETHVSYTLFDVVRSPMSHAVSIEDVGRGWPSLPRQLHQDDAIDQGRRILDDAWRKVRAELATVGIDEQGLYDPEVVDELVILAARKLLATSGISPPGLTTPDFVVITTDEWNRYFEQMFKAEHRPSLRTDSGGDADLPVSTGAWMK